MSQAIFFARGTHRLKASELESYEKSWLGKRVHTGQVDTKKEATRLGLDYKCLNNYGIMFGKGSLIQSKPGRPQKISLERGLELQEDVWEAEQKDDCVKHDDFDPLLYEKARQTAQDQRKPIPKPLSRSTKERAKKILGIRSVKGQQTTSARFEAERDPRNCISSIILGRYFRKILANPALLINFDATQMNKNEKNDTRDRVMRVRDAVHKARYKHPLKTSATGGKQTEMAFFCKGIPVISAGGFKGPFVQIQADSRLGKDEMHWFEIPGGDWDPSNLSAVGHLVLVNSRGTPPVAFMQRYYSHIMLPFLDKCRILSGDPNAVAACMMDGESANLTAAISPQIIAQAGANTCLSKTGASCTGNSQAADCGDGFCDLKALGRSGKVDDNFSNEFVRKEFERQYLEYEKARGFKEKWSAQDRRNSIEGFLKMRSCMGEAFTKHVIMESFKVAAWIGNDNSICDDFRFLVNFQLPVTEPEYADLNIKADLYAPKMENGTLTDADIDTFLVIQNLKKNGKLEEENKNPRDQRALGENRCVLLNSPGILAREREREDEARVARERQEARKKQKAEEEKLTPAEKEAKAKAEQDAKKAVNDKNKAEKKKKADDKKQAEKEEKRQAKEDNRGAADAATTAAAAGGGGAEDGAGKKAKIRGVKRASGSANGPNKKAKEDSSNICKNCDEKYVEAAVGWVGCSFCNTWYCRDCKGSVKNHEKKCAANPNK
jgi:hypothetical protein